MPKVLTGVVISTKMQATAVVEVTRHKPHPVYRKLLKRSKKYKVDTTGVEVAQGQRVKIVETKPLSKDKYFKIMSTTVAKEEQAE